MKKNKTYNLKLEANSKKLLSYSLLLTVCCLLLTACGNKRTSQSQFMPDMYVSVPYDVNGANSPVNKGEVNLKPVPGTVKRGGYPAYDFENTNEGYEKAKAELKNPLEVNKVNLENGKKMYDIYCAVCHGKKGDGNGILNERDKFSGIPNYKDREITEGSIYHVIMYGKNLMGSHASQLTPTERWQVVQHVEELKNK